MVSPKLWIIERFAPCADMIGRSTYKALVAIFNRQCEASEGKVMVKAKTGGDCIQNPSDADATYDAHKGRGGGPPTFWHQGNVGGLCRPKPVGLRACPDRLPSQGIFLPGMTL